MWGLSSPNGKGSWERTSLESHTFSSYFCDSGAKCRCSVLVSFTVSCDSPTKLPQDLTGLLSLPISGFLNVSFPFLQLPRTFPVPLLTPVLKPVCRQDSPTLNPKAPEDLQGCLPCAYLSFSALCGKDALIERLWIQGDSSIPKWFNPRHLTCLSMCLKMPGF